jgi:hypothetical protein
MFDRCFVVSDTRVQMVPTRSHPLDMTPQPSAAVTLVHSIMTVDVFLSGCYPEGQTETERFLGLQRTNPTSEDDMSGLYYDYSISVLGNRLLPSLNSNTIRNTFSDTRDKKFGVIISQHTDRYIRSLQARYDEFYDNIQDRICLILCHPSYGDAVMKHVKEYTILKPVEVRWFEDRNVIITG